MSLSVIVTRTLPDANDTCERLAERGFAPLLSPMLHLVFHALNPSLFDGVAHVIFTSANGVRAAGNSNLAARLTAWCVGATTAEAARAAGFGEVVSGDGNADDLAQLILAARPRGPLLHIANEDAAGALVAALRAGGLDARFAAPYRTEPAPGLTAEARLALAGSSPVVLLLHSAKAASAVAASGANLSQAGLVGISAAALAPLADAAVLGRFIAERPNETALLAAVEQAATALTR